MAYNAKIPMTSEDETTPPPDVTMMPVRTEMPPEVVNPRKQTHGAMVSALAKTGAGGQAVSALARSTPGGKPAA